MLVQVKGVHAFLVLQKQKAEKKAMKGANALELSAEGRNNSIKSSEI